MSSQTNAPNASNSDPRTVKDEGCMGQLEAGIAISGSLSESCQQGILGICRASCEQFVGACARQDSLREPLIATPASNRPMQPSPLKALGSLFEALGAFVCELILCLWL